MAISPLSNRRRVLLSLLAITLTLVLFGSNDSLNRLYSKESFDENSDDELRETFYREGAIFRDQGGQFKGGSSDEERPQYIPKMGEPLFVLENLAIERVVNERNRNVSDQVKWEVEGVITEYKSKNYLLLKRATVIH